MAKRKLLLVLDSEFTRYTALKRGTAYCAFFANCPTWEATYIDLSQGRGLQHTNPILRLVDRGVSRIHLAMERRHWTSSRQDEIVDVAKSFDAVYLLKTPTAELQKRLIALDGPRVIVDLNDALWLPFHAQYFGELNSMLQKAHGVICENQYIADYVEQFNRSIRIVPDCTQLESFDAIREHVGKDGSKVRLGWIGSTGTAGSLYAIWETLEALFKRHSNLELRILGAGASSLPHFERVRWSSLLRYDREQMVREALAMDIGLFPLFNVEDSLARGNGKAVVYMAAGAVALCEKFGEHTRLIRDRANGVLAGGQEEWFERLDWLVTDPQARNEIGRAGLETVRLQLGDDRCFQTLIDALDSFVAGGRSSVTRLTSHQDAKKSPAAAREHIRS